MQKSFFSKKKFHKQIMRMQGPQTLKNFFLSEKKLLNAILRAKLKYMKNVSF